jgi:hypothetical protein
MSPVFKKQIEILSDQELLDFYDNVKHRLEKTALDFTQRNTLRQLKPELEEIVSSRRCARRLSL